MNQNRESLVLFYALCDGMMDAMTSGEPFWNICTTAVYVVSSLLVDKGHGSLISASDADQAQLFTCSKEAWCF